MVCLRVVCISSRLSLSFPLTVAPGAIAGCSAEFVRCPISRKNYVVVVPNTSGASLLAPSPQADADSSKQVSGTAVSACFVEAATNSSLSEKDEHLPAASYMIAHQPHANAVVQPQQVTDPKALEEKLVALLSRSQQVCVLHFLKAHICVRKQGAVLCPLSWKSQCFPHQLHCIIVNLNHAG